MVNVKEVEEFVKNDLKNQTKYLELPSVSAQNKGIHETVAYLTDTFKSLNADDVKVFDQYRNPCVYAEFKGKSDKTVLFYSHYDVQPPEPLEKWHSDPFTPTFKDGKLFARGVLDCKGEMMSRFSVIKYYQQHGGLPCNLKFFVEGSEEVGSLDIEKYVNDAKDYLQCDAMVWETGQKNANDQLTLSCGLKGIVSFDVEVKTADTDAHSSLAAFLNNAAWRLVQGLSSLYDSDRNIKVKGFTDNVRSLDDYTKSIIDEGEKRFDAKKVAAAYGMNKLPVNNPHYAAMNLPTMTINGLSAGYEGEGVKTVVPCHAYAKLDCRLVPGQDPHEVTKLVQKQLNANGFSDLKVKFNLGEHAYRSNMQDKFVQDCVATAKEVYGKNGYELTVNSPGGGPLYPFSEVTHAPAILFGCGYGEGKPHAPNENIRVSDYLQVSGYLAKLLEKFSED